MGALLDAVLASGEDRFVQLLDDGEQRHVLLDREQRARAIARVEPAVAKPQLHLLDLRLEPVGADVAHRFAVAVLAHEVHAGVGAQVHEEEVVARRVLGVERVVVAPRGEPAVGDLDLDLGEVADVEDVQDQRAQVERLHRGLEARLRAVQHERHLRIAVGLRERVEGVHLLPGGGAARLVQEVAPLHEAVDRVQREAGHAEHRVERLARGGPCVAVAQEPLEAVGGLEADALDVEREVAIGLRHRGRLAQEVDLVVEEQRLEMLLDAHELLQALDREIGSVLAELADRREEGAARGRLAHRIQGEDALGVGEFARHVRRPRTSRRCAAPASGWAPGPAR